MPDGLEQFNKAVLDLEELDPVVTFSDGGGARLALCYHKGMKAISVIQAYWTGDDNSDLAEVTQVFLDDYAVKQLKKLLEANDAN